MQHGRDRISASVSAFYPKECQGPARPVADSAADILRAGFGIELWLSEYDFTPYTRESIETLRELCRAAGTVTVHTSTYTWDGGRLRAEIPLAASFGAGILVVHPRTFGFENCDDPPGPGELRDICRCALDSGLYLAFENSGRTGMPMMDRALDVIGVDPEATGLGICIDTGHANRSYTNDGIPPAAYIEKFRDIILELHINDNLGAEDIHLPPGEGTIDWPAVFAAMRGLRDDAVICLELMKSTDDPMAALVGAREFVWNGIG